MKDLERWINDNKSNVERQILRNRASQQLIRTRERDKEERKIIDKLCMRKWKKAEQAGKIKYISSRKWYYDDD